ncbi:MULTISPECIES: hypothetical protein [Clostridium]
MNFCCNTTGCGRKHMKKKFLFHQMSFLIVFFCIIISISGCGLNRGNNTKNASNNFDMKSAANTADNYMKYLMKNDMENAKKLYSKDLLKNEPNMTGRNLRILGYNLTDSSEVGKSGILKMKVARADLSKPFAALDEYSIKVIKEGNDYKIDETNNVTDREAFVEKNKLKMRNKNDVSINIVTDIRSMPNYVFSKDDKANVYKVPVPKSNFGIINFSYDGDRMAVVTYSKDSYIGIIRINESMQTQSQDSDEQGGGSSEQGNSGGDQQNDQKEENKPIGKDITDLDVLKDSKVEFLTFSPDEKFIAVQYSSDTIGNCIRVYKTDSGDMISYKFEKEFPLNKVNVIFSSFDEGILSFDVVSKNNNNEELPKIIGEWELDLRNFKAVKI